jgi:2-hydroxychromene-2-carboxylate isomerase
LFYTGKFDVCRAGWQDDKNIGDEGILREVLHTAGFDDAKLLADASRDDVKAALKKNTDDAAANGLCGVPTFQVKTCPFLTIQKRTIINDSG